MPWAFETIERALEAEAMRRVPIVASVMGYELAQAAVMIAFCETKLHALTPVADLRLLSTEEIVRLLKLSDRLK